MIEQIITREDVIPYLIKQSQSDPEPNIIEIQRLVMVLEMIHGKDRGIERFLNILLNPSVSSAVQKVADFKRPGNKSDVLGTERSEIKTRLSNLFDDPREQKYLFNYINFSDDVGTVLFSFYKDILHAKLDQFAPVYVDEPIEKYLEKRANIYKPEISKDKVTKTLDWLEKEHPRAYYHLNPDAKLNHTGLTIPSERFYDDARKYLSASLGNAQHLIALLELAYDQDRDLAFSRVTNILLDKESELESHLQGYFYPKGFPEAFTEPNQKDNNFGIPEQAIQMGDVFKTVLNSNETYVIEQVGGWDSQLIGFAALSILCFLEPKNREAFNYTYHGLDRENIDNI